MEPLARIVSLLDDASPRKRVAAAVVLGELEVKDAATVARLVAMARDPVDAFAEVALEALGRARALKALPVMLEALGRGRDVQAAAKAAIASLGEAALPELKARLDAATPEVRALLSQLLPAVGGRQSFELVLEGLRGQPWDAINRAALSVRQEARALSPAERKVLRTQVEKFLGQKKTAADEPAVRGAIKILGLLELPDAQATLLGYLSPKAAPLVRAEAATALRFAMGAEPSRPGLRRLMELLEDPDAVVARAARDSLTVLKIGPSFAAELAELCQAKEGEVALWAIRHLGALAQDHQARGGAAVIKALLPVARGPDRARAEAAALQLAALPAGPAHLVQALCEAEDEAGAHVLADTLVPLAATLPPKALAALRAAGAAQLGSHFAVARRQLDPVRAGDPEGWAGLLREKMKALAKKDPARADALRELLARSGVATRDDRFSAVVQQFAHHGFDLHPRVRARDAALTELERLHAEGFPVAARVAKEAGLSDEARYYVGVHFAEKQPFELKNLGAEVLEALAGSGRGKLAKAAKNKMKLLEL